MKPPRSILSKEFVWTKPEHTDVGKYLREHLRSQKREAEAKRLRVVTPLQAKARKPA